MDEIMHTYNIAEIPPTGTVTLMFLFSNKPEQTRVVKVKNN